MWPRPSSSADRPRSPSTTLPALLAAASCLALGAAEDPGADAPDRPTGAGTGMGAMAMPMAAHGIDVVTRSYGIGRTGGNTHESVLTPAAVAGGLRRLFQIDVTRDPAHPDDPRIEAQPLIVAGLPMPDGHVHDVVYVATMANNVWAFDADTGAALWPAPVSLGTPVTPAVTPADGFPTRTAIDLWGINIHWGVLSTPVIDRPSNTMYVVNWTSPDGSVAKAFWQLHALDIVTGKERPQSPVKLAAQLPDTGPARASFIPSKQKQRAALLLLPGTASAVRAAGEPPVLSGGMGDADQPGGHHAAAAAAHPAPGTAVIVACGGFGESANGQHGWLLAYDAQTLQQTAAFCTTPESGGGGIWQGGQGPAADRGGNIYVMTSNGGFNGTTDFAESFLMVHYTAPRAGEAKGKLDLVTWFTPFRDGDRVVSEPGTGYNFRDQDLGSAGPLALSGSTVLGAGKDGVLYVLAKGRFGNTTMANLDANTQYAALRSPPIFFTYFPGFQVSPTELEDLDRNFQGKTHHLHHSPVYWNSPERGQLLFCWGENENLRAWSLTSAGVVSYLAIGHETSSAGMGGMGGMPGAMLAITANGNAKHSGVVWALAPINGDGNKYVVEGILRAYDATEFDVNPDGSSNLRLLWDSKRIHDNTFKYDKFCPPVVANGKVYVATYEGRVDVYGK